MKKILILVVLLLVLLGGAGGGLYFMGMLDPLLGKDPESVAAAEAAAVAAEEAANPVFVPMDVLAAPIIVDGRVRNQVLLSLSLQVKDQSARNDVIAKMPRLRDAMLQDLYTEPVVREGSSGAIDINGVKARLLAIAHRVMGSERVRDVLVIKAVQTG